MKSFLDKEVGYESLLFEHVWGRSNFGTEGQSIFQWPEIQKLVSQQWDWQSNLLVIQDAASVTECYPWHDVMEVLDRNKKNKCQMQSISRGTEQPTDKKREQNSWLFVYSEFTHKICNRQKADTKCQKQMLLYFGEFSSSTMLWAGVGSSTANSLKLHMPTS